MTPSNGSQAALYDERYRDGSYRRALNSFEFARWRALSHFIPRVVGLQAPHTMLDYGAGRGLYLPLWEQLFPHAELWACDISGVALDQLRADHPQLAKRAITMQGSHTPLPDASFDAIVSIEVLEHVENLADTLADVVRLLKPGGTFIWTTPCGNALSIEQLYAVLTGQIDVSRTGEMRFTWEDPTHLRRLRTGPLTAALQQAGFTGVVYRFRAHLFSFLGVRLVRRRHPGAARRLMMLDYALFRRLPNGASMLGAARKPHPEPTSDHHSPPGTP